jgi:hypothetical protein
VQVRLLGDKTPSAAVPTDLRLIRYTYFGTYATLPGHEGDERDEQRDKAVLAVIALGRRNRGGQDFDEHDRSYA